MLLSPDESRLYVTLANRDAVAVINAQTGSVERYLDTRLPGQQYGGSYPQATDAIGGRDSPVCCQWVFGCSRGLRSASRKSKSLRAAYFIPTEWYPTALAIKGDELFVATGKGIGTGPNSADMTGDEHARHKHPYIASLIHGSIAHINISQAEKNRKQLTQKCCAAIVCRGAPERSHSQGGSESHPPRYLHPERKPHLRPDLRRYQGRQRRSFAGHVRRGDHAQSSTRWPGNSACSTTSTIAARSRATDIPGPPPPSTPTTASAHGRLPIAARSATTIRKAASAMCFRCCWASPM